MGRRSKPSNPRNDGVRGGRWNRNQYTRDMKPTYHPNKRTERHHDQTNANGASWMRCGAAPYNEWRAKKISTKAHLGPSYIGRRRLVGDGHGSSLASGWEQRNAGSDPFLSCRTSAQIPSMFKHMTYGPHSSCPHKYGGNVQGGEEQHVNDLQSYVGGQTPRRVHYICALVSFMRLQKDAA